MKVSAEQEEALKRTYGYASASLGELIEIDHRRPRYARVLPHGPDGPLASAEDGAWCPECLREAKRKRTLEERQDLLLNELLGDTVFIRGKGYKTMRKAVVECYESVRDGHLVQFRYTGESRGNSLDRIPRLDVVIDGERVTVWDDGEEDLNVWERGQHANSARPCKRTYQEAVG
jgi:hypothetical protein